MITQTIPATEALEESSPASVSEQATRQPFSRFLAWFLLPPLLFYVLAFALVRIPSYERWGPSQWGPMLEWAFDANHVDADVVLFGDSSAFLGVDPRIVNARLAVRTAVLPNTIGSLPVTGDLALVRYLRQNAPPRLIVFYFSPWNLDYDQTANVRLFEGEEMMFRHSDSSALKAFARKHPIELLAFPLRLYSTFGPNMFRSMLRHTNRERDTAVALGHVDDHDPFPPLSKTCALPAKYLDESRIDSVRRLAEKFRTPETEVMVYLAPVPHCGNSAPILARAYPDLDAKPPAPLPPSSFLGDPYFAHVEPGSVPLASEVFATALSKKLASFQPRPAVAHAQPHTPSGSPGAQ